MEKRKRGPLGKAEKKFIADNSGNMTAAEMAEKLRRSEEFVANYMRSNAATVAQPRKEVNTSIGLSLRSSEKWKRLANEFTNDEILFFEEEYVKLFEQFQGNVLPSEETQIFDAIKYDILKGRNMAKRKKAIVEIQRLEDEQSDFLTGFPDPALDMTDDDRQRAATMEEQLNVLRRAEQDCTSEYVKLQERQDALMKALKSTRDQRFRDVETNKVSILTLLKRLQQTAVARKEGREAGLYKMAGEREYNRLGQLHEYEDGTVDRPILSADTIDLVDDADVEPDGREDDDDE